MLLCQWLRERELEVDYAELLWELETEESTSTDYRTELERTSQETKMLEITMPLGLVVSVGSLAVVAPPVAWLLSIGFFVAALASRP